MFSRPLFHFKKFIINIIFFIFCISPAQNIYQGQIIFDYSGTVDGVFTSTVDDTLATGIAFNEMVEDTAFFLMASITQQGDNTFDLFLAVLRDTTYPIQSRIWDIPGEGDEENPLSLETILIFMPGLDSLFVNDLFETFTDTSSNNDTTDILGDVFSNLSDNLYLGLDGELEIATASDSLITGYFNTFMLKPAFHFPPHTVNINNGEFLFNISSLPELKTKKENPLNPTSFKLSPVYPNPFNNATTIQYFLPDNFIELSLAVYDIKGKRLETINTSSATPGINTVKWNPNNLSTGVYFLVLYTKKTIQSQKLILLK